MKRFNLIALLLLSAISAQITANGCCRTEACPPEDSCDVEYTGRTFLFERPAFLSVSPEMIAGFKSDRLHFREDGLHGTAEAVVFGNQSTNKIDLARYFFPNGKTELIVDEQINNTFPPLPQDLLAQNFNIFTVHGDFRSQISIRPETSQVGVGFYGRKAFCVNEEKGRGFFTSLSFAVMRVKNDLNFEENIINDGGGANYNAVNRQSGYYVASDMTDALNQDGFEFGRISPFAMTKTGVADIEFKVGYEWIQQEPFHLESYIGMLIPTGNKPDARYMFQPIVGQGHHWGLIYGSSLGIHIWENESANRTLRVEYAMHSQYLFGNTQCRTFDLDCKQWSRYLSMYANKDQAVVASTLPYPLSVNYATPGVNLLTLESKVRPGFLFNMTMSGIYDTHNWSLEGGYNLYYRQAECVKLACPWQEGPAIKMGNITPFGENLGGSGQTNPIRDITGNYLLETGAYGMNDDGITNTKITLADYNFNLLTADDINLNSASSPSVLTFTVYGTVSYNWDDMEYPTFANFGGSYEFANNNAATERWTIWGKLGLSF